MSCDEKYVGYIRTSEQDVLTMTDTVEIPLIGKNKDKSIIVSKEDYEQVSKYNWTLWNGYPYNSGIGYLHYFIMGERPSDVPDDYVIDHKDRKPLNAARPNLRHVSKSFNSWNKAVKPDASSRFKGVLYNKFKRKWEAYFLKKYIGTYAVERDAAKVVARAAIKKWPDLALSSDLLIAEDLLTTAEIADIESNIENDINDLSSRRAKRDLPVGVSKYHNTGRYMVRVADRFVGVYDTVSVAKSAYDKSMENHKSAETRRLKTEWKKYRSSLILRDDDGDAVVRLSGKLGEGMQAKVPAKIWHKLTFKVSWNYAKTGYAQGCWQGKPAMLHKVVYALCNPKVAVQGTIDHIDPSQKLNNLENNLRDATRHIQAYNKQKSVKKVGKYIGINYKKAEKTWYGSISHERKRYYTKSYKSEDAVIEPLNILTRQLKGDYARIQSIIK